MNPKRIYTLFLYLTLLLAFYEVHAQKSSEKHILSFQEGPQNVPIDETGKKITWTVPGFVNLTSTTPTIRVSDKATINPKSGVAQDFSKPVYYTVTAEDGSTAVYTAAASKGEGETILKADHTDVPYATKSPAQKLDVYVPKAGKGPFPVIVQIHGGAFKGGDKADEQVNASLNGLKRGYAIVSINYRLSGEAIFPAQIQDVKAAIRFIRANAKTYNVDPNKIATWGGSAGGHLAAMAGTTGDVAEFDDGSLGNTGVSSRVQAVVDWFGPIQFDQMDAQFRASGKGQPTHDAANSPESELVGKQITQAADLVKRASPATYISKADPPFFIQHGTVDPLVPTQQSTNFAGDLVNVLGNDKVTFVLLDGAGHGGPQFSAPANLARVFAWLDNVLKTAEK